MRGRVTLVNLVYNLFGITLCFLARISGQNELISVLRTGSKPHFNSINASLTTTEIVVAKVTWSGEGHLPASSGYASNQILDLEEAQGSTTISISIVRACVRTQACKSHCVAYEGIECSDSESAGA